MTAKLRNKGPEISCISRKVLQNQSFCGKLWCKRIKMPESGQKSLGVGESGW